MINSLIALNLFTTEKDKVMASLFACGILLCFDVVSYTTKQCEQDVPWCWQWCMLDRQLRKVVGFSVIKEGNRDFWPWCQVSFPYTSIIPARQGWWKKRGRLGWRCHPLRWQVRFSSFCCSAQLCLCVTAESHVANLLKVLEYFRW